MRATRITNAILKSALLALTLLLVMPPLQSAAEDRTDPCEMAATSLLRAQKYSSDQPKDEYSDIDYLDAAKEFDACAVTYEGPYETPGSPFHLSPHACDALLASADAYVEAVNILKQVPPISQYKTDVTAEFYYYLRAVDNYQDASYCEGAGKEAGRRGVRTILEDLRKLDLHKVDFSSAP